MSGPRRTEAAGRIIAHYERHALAWNADRARADWNDKPWHVRLADALPAGATVLDLGCGSGSPVGSYLAGRGFSLTGVDSSPTLISLARQTLPAHEWMVADMRGLDLGRRFGAVLAWDSVFHLTPEDQREMFAVLARHTAPSGLLMFNTGPRFGEVTGEYRGDPLYHASLDASDYTARLLKQGFAIVAHVVEDWQTGGGRTVWLARRQD